MPKPVRKKVKKVLKPAQSTDVKLFAKSLFVRSTHGQACQDGSSTSISTDDLISKMNHYSVKVQEKTLLKLEVFLKSNGSLINSEQKLKVLQAAVYKLLSEHDSVRKQCHQILLYIANAGILDASHLEKTIFPTLRAAMTHTDPDIRLGTLSFLGPFLSICEVGGFDSRGSKSRRFFEVDAFHLLFTLLDVLSEELLSKKRLLRLNDTLYSIGKLFDIISRGHMAHSLIYRSIRGESLSMMDLVLALIRFLASGSTLETIFRITNHPREFTRSSELCIHDEKMLPGIEHEILSGFLKCLAHSLSTLFLIRNAGQKKKKLNHNFVSSMKNTLNFFQQLFEGCEVSCHRTNIVILVKLIRDEMKEHCLEEFDSFNNSVTNWLIEAYCLEKHVLTSRKLALLVWENAHLENQRHDNRPLLIKLFPDAGIPSNQKVYIRDFIRLTIRRAASQSKFEFFANGIIGLMRERVESLVEEWDAPKISQANELDDWEFELFSDLPYVLWKLLKKRSLSPPSPFTENESKVLDNATTILWHVIRSFGGPFSSEETCSRHMNKMLQGVSLLHKKSKFSPDENNTLSRFLHRTRFYIDSLEAKMV